MLPAQDDIAVRVVVHFKDRPDLVYETPVTDRLSIPPKDAQAELIAAQEQPVPFWSRAGREMRCVLPLDVDSAQIERAVLHVVVWDGGRGTVDAPFTLNDYPLPVAGQGNHGVLYRQVEIDPAILQRGENTIRLRSDTEHHGIEVLRPGPALMVRYKGN
jgi:hypothetical protein